MVLVRIWGDNYANFKINLTRTRNHVVFKKKFGLINDFEARKKVGSQTDADAIRVGKVALTLGAGLLVLFVLLMIFT